MRFSLVMIVGALACCGCASRHPITPISSERVVVLELPPIPSPRSLSRVLQRKRTSDEPTLAADRARITQALDRDLRAELSAGPMLPSIAITPLDQPGTAEIGRPLDGPALLRLQSLQPADAYIRIRVTDYGQTPRRWEGAYIGFEVVSTLAIAGALYVHAVTRPVAAAYLAEESVEEISEGYAGFWALNRLSRPVRVEADLIDGRTGHVLWREAHTGLSRWRWRNLRHQDDAARDALLDTSLRKALNTLAKSLRNELGYGQLAWTPR